MVQELSFKFIDGSWIDEFTFVAKAIGTLPVDSGELSFTFAAIHGFRYKLAFVAVR